MSSFFYLDYEWIAIESWCHITVIKDNMHICYNFLGGIRMIKLGKSNRTR